MILRCGFQGQRLHFYYPHCVRHLKGRQLVKVHASAGGVGQGVVFLPYTLVAKVREFGNPPQCIAGHNPIYATHVALLLNSHEVIQTFVNPLYGYGSVVQAFRACMYEDSTPLARFSLSVWQVYGNHVTMYLKVLYWFL
jgi:hypothetical protein